MNKLIFVSLSIQFSLQYRLVQSPISSLTDITLPSPDSNFFNLFFRSFVLIILLTSVSSFLRCDLTILPCFIPNNLQTIRTQKLCSERKKNKTHSPKLTKLFLNLILALFVFFFVYSSHYCIRQPSWYEKEKRNFQLPILF